MKAPVQYQDFCISGWSSMNVRDLPVITITPRWGPTNLLPIIKATNSKLKNDSPLGGRVGCQNLLLQDSPTTEIPYRPCAEDVSNVASQ